MSRLRLVLGTSNDVVEVLQWGGIIRTTMFRVKTWGHLEAAIPCRGLNAGVSGGRAHG